MPQLWPGKPFWKYLVRSFFRLLFIWGHKVGILNNTNSDSRPNFDRTTSFDLSDQENGLPNVFKMASIFCRPLRINCVLDIPSDFLRKKLYYCLWFPCICYSVHICSIYLIFLMYFCPFRPSSSKQRTIIIHIQHSLHYSV